MNLSLIRSMTRSAVFELENGLCYRPAHPFTVTLNGKTVYEACQTNVFSLFSLLPGTEYTVGVQAEGESLTCTFTTEAETFFVDASRYGLVADGTTDNTLKLQAALSTCPKGGTVYVPAGRYRTCSLFLKSNTTLYLEKGAVLLGDNDRTHYPILPGVIPSENEVDEYYLTGWEGNPLRQLCGSVEHHAGARCRCDRRGHAGLRCRERRLVGNAQDQAHRMAAPRCGCWWTARTSACTASRCRTAIRGRSTPSLSSTLTC